MTLAELQTKLQVAKTNTNISDVVCDSTLYFNVNRSKTYPFVLWAMDGAKYQKDVRTSTTQETKIITLTVFAVIAFNVDTETRITVWDTIEGYFNAYLNAVNAVSDIQVMNIAELEGVYLHEGENSDDKELGIMFPKIILKMSC